MEDEQLWASKFTPCKYSNKLISKILLINKGRNKKDALDILEIQKAIYFAKKYHGSQKRQSGEPYYSHPLEVAYMVVDYLPKTNIMVTAILHDCIEDTNLTFEMIKALFGSTIAVQVLDLSRIKPQGYKLSAAELAASLWREQKYELLLVKILDRLHNMQTIDAKAPEKIAKTVKETLLYFLPLSEILGVPQLCDYLYYKCHEANIKLGVVAAHECLFDQPLDFVELPAFENMIR